MEEQQKKTSITKTEVFNKIMLLSAPWAAFSRPSIQLGALKAYLKSRFPDLVAVCHHFYLQVAANVGYPEYKAIAEHMWPAECVYAAMLYPERTDQIAELFQSGADKNPELGRLDFARLVHRVQMVSDAFIDRVDWQELDFVGVSVCLCQLNASLYLLRRIRKQAPDLPLLAGGSIMGGDYARDYLKAFPEIDIIFCGEGERPLARLVAHLKSGGSLADFSCPAGVVNRHAPPGGGCADFLQLPDLSALPEPDFGEYFALLRQLPQEKKFFPTLPAEMSRGCWWRAADPGTGEKGCAFCNLNLQWAGYRKKPAEQVAADIRSMTDQHQLLSVAFTDNSLPPKQSRKIFHEVSASGKDFHFFSELRASTDKQSLEIFAEAGMNEVQVGIEALSDSLLKKINKGTSAIENLELMKNCEALGIRHNSNLIIHFPGSDATDVEQTLRTIACARVFYPLRIVHFWLGLGSPVWKNPGKYGIQAVFNHPNYRVLFPEELYRRIRFMVQDYRGDKTLQRKLWKPVVRAVEDWKKSYRQLHAEPFAAPVISYQDGGGFLIIRRRRLEADTENHRLTGTSRRIYLFCGHRRHLDEIAREFPEFSADDIQSFLQMMTNKGLMFEDGKRYLSLAVPFRRNG
ncbi:MAG: RiPP maturation radical SAM C-methyltransferase [Desulfosalsimonadaceae bacterium]